ncbi:MAG: Asp-tRNA(Asn)/Glu-tRNA(Gln) amidotransferase subunit GatB [Proteobacteria bacterium]|nr:Asp-tRNA(Asn)/Glu-tRNA(Gln) amidotransferase subunit GatB [Pseudomonadota bacterium]
MARYEAVIGLEVHAQLATRSKMFCACASNLKDAPPNTTVCPVCTGHPGTLPTVNAGAVEMAIKVGLALGCKIHARSIFARKNYFYPDLPKGYQISQYESPLCTGGSVKVKTKRTDSEFPLIRIHLEEDAGKLMHDYGHPEKSHVDFNRCGVPLIEIVSGPDMRSPGEAGDYLRTLRNVLVYLGVCEGNLQEGNFRCDANISIRPVGQREFGTRAEMKNLNSFKAVERAVAYEIERQIKVVDGGGKVVQETRLWNDAAGRTESMRSKEEAHDYRYFPDPDLMPLTVDEKWIGRVRATLPELAHAKAMRFTRDYGITEADALIMTEDKRLADYFEETAACGAPPKKAANWIISELLRELKESEEGIAACPIGPEKLAELIGLIEDGTISGKTAKTIFAAMYRGEGVDIRGLIESKNLQQNTDSKIIEKHIDDAIAANPKQLEQYRSGKKAVLGFFVGQIMKATEGTANPELVNELLKRKLK